METTHQGKECSYFVVKKKKGPIVTSHLVHGRGGQF